MNEMPAQEHAESDSTFKSARSAIPIGFILPKETAAAARSQGGRQASYPVEQPDGGIRLSPYDPEACERTMEIARRASWTSIAIRLRRLPNERADLARISMSSHRHPCRATCAASAGRRHCAIEGMLRSALERPVNKWSYEQTDLAALAAAYAFGLARNHAFVDGNKRIAFMAHDGVSARQRRSLSRPIRRSATAMILALAAGEVSEESLTRWIRDNWPAE